MSFQRNHAQNPKKLSMFIILISMLLCFGLLLSDSTNLTQASTTNLQSSLITSGNDWSGFPSISADGRWVAFASNANNLVESDNNQIADIFVYDRLTGHIERASISSDGLEANAISTRPAISADGRFVAFESLADNLVPGDTNFLSDIFVYDRLTMITERVSVDANGFEGNGWSERASISSDGHYVAFISEADNLLPNDTNGVRDAFLHNRLSGYTQRVSIQSDGSQLTGESKAAKVTPSGRTVVFTLQTDSKTNTSNLQNSIFSHNRLIPRTIQIPNTRNGDEPDTSTGGQWIAYRLPNDPESDQHVYVYDQLNDSTYTARFPVPLTQHAIGDNGKHIAAIGATIDGLSFNLYWHNLESGETIELVEGVSDTRPDISEDGNFVAYVQEINGTPQISVFDRGAQPEPKYFVSGRVRGPLGDPLALVQIDDNHGNTVETDKLGYFFLSGVKPGQVSLSLSKKGYNFEPGGASFIVVSDLVEKNFTYYSTDVIDEARKDIGMPYDHRCEGRPECEGDFHGYAAGQCSDLVLDAFTWGADYNIKLALEQDALAHPEHFYQSRNARDAFDMWRYFMYSGQMVGNDQLYQPGDMVFFDWSGDGEIDHVALVSQVNENNQPTWMVDATGIIASNPGGLAAELPWEPFHERSKRGHARWTGAYESPVLEPPQGNFLQIGLGSVGADLHLISEQGYGLGETQGDMPNGTFFNLIWEQNLTVANPLMEGAYPDSDVYYYVVISNPTDERMPYYFVVQTVQNENIDYAEKFTGQLNPGQIRYLPLKLSQNSNELNFEFVSLTRKNGGEIKW
jgi:Tol biopolymer transport system component